MSAHPACGEGRSGCNPFRDTRKAGRTARVPLPFAFKAAHPAGAPDRFARIPVSLKIKPACVTYLLQRCGRNFVQVVCIRVGCGCMAARFGLVGGGFWEVLRGKNGYFFTAGAKQIELLVKFNHKLIEELSDRTHPVPYVIKLKKEE